MPQLNHHSNCYSSATPPPEIGSTAAEPAPSPAVEACVIMLSLLCLAVFAKFQSPQVYHASALFCMHPSRVCDLKQTLAQQYSMTAASAKHETTAQSCLLPLLLCTFSAWTWEFISASFHQELRKQYFSSYIEEKVTEYVRVLNLSKLLNISYCKTSGRTKIVQKIGKENLQY